MNQVEQVRGDIAKMIDMGAPMSDVDAYVSAHGLTPDDFAPSTASEIGSGAKALGEGAYLGLGKLGTGIIQAGATIADNKPLVESTKRVATNLTNQSNKNKEKNPVLGTAGELAPQLGVVAPLGFSLPAITGGSAILSALSPNANKTDPTEGTALERLMQPVGEGVSSIVSAAGIDPSSLTGKALSGAVMGAGSYGMGKSLGPVARGANNATKATVRGLTRINPEAVTALEQSGINPTLQFASDSPVLRSVSNSMQKLPLVGNRLESEIESAIRKLTSNVDDVGKPLGEASDAIEGGQAIQRGIDQFNERTGKMITKNYEQVDNLIPEGTAARTDNIQKFSKNYREKTNTTPLDRAVSEGEVNKVTNAAIDATSPSKINTGILDAEGKSIFRVENPNVPYSSLKNTRSKIGEKAGRMDSPGEYKQMYGALSKDMQATAKGVSPEAAQAASRANNYYRAVTQRSEKLKTFFAQNQDGTFVMAPERAAAASRADLALLKKSIPKEDFNNYTSSVVRKMGEATPGAQNATGDIFSPNTFLTNYTKLKQSGKASVLFNKQTAAELERAAQVADRFRQLGKTANTSNTANSALSTGAMVGIFLKPVATATIGIPAYGFERLLTSPKALKVINDYAYRPVMKNAKLRGEFSTKLLQAAGQDAQTQEAAKNYLKELEPLQPLNFE